MACDAGTEGTPSSFGGGGAELGVRALCQTQVSGACGSVVRSQMQLRRVVGRMECSLRLVVCGMGLLCARKQSFGRALQAGSRSRMGRRWDARGLRLGRGGV